MKLLDIFKKPSPKNPKEDKKVYIERNYESDFRSLNPKELYKNEFFKISLNTDPDSVYVRIRNQARGLGNASALISSFFETMESEMYGDMGFILDVNTGNDELDKKVEGLFAHWCLFCDLEEIFDFRDFEELALKHYLRDGECFIHLCDTQDGFKIQFIPPEYIPSDFDNNDDIKKGIELKSSDPFNAKDIYNDTDIESKAKQETRIIEAGKLNVFDSNLKLHPLTPPPSTDMNTFLYSCDRDIAKGLGLSYATLTGDLQKSNYSSTREGKTNERRMFRRTQQKFIRKMHNIECFYDLDFNYKRNNAFVVSKNI
ncbi:hypothetical protein BKH42_06905 [Helicobacter sp. 13S00482-2]|uniref:phage portal protein n=1 Tax=Helicobacter sp. 13S00482-2 TaxID=1476200 RepID=UPI000BA74478|nr:phage portal protein [Helicobacter sp. 13S00482-2]PAF53251.1 hypothetical protein BKH42_06905 [Helicobacter sp. 13S00482-2]